MVERGIVAQFYKEPGGRLALNSLTVIECKSDHVGGREYIARTEYDVDWSRSYGYLFHQSGGGGRPPIDVSGVYFTSGAVAIKENPATWCDGRGRERRTKAIRKRNRTRRLLNLPKAIDLRDGQDLFDWLQDNGINQDAVWCSECRDFVLGDELCKHTWWCEKIGWYSTPADRCGHERGDCEA